jgi:hypothetical protein
VDAGQAICDQETLPSNRDHLHVSHSESFQVASHILHATVFEHSSLMCLVFSPEIQVLGMISPKSCTIPSYITYELDFVSSVVSYVGSHTVRADFLWRCGAGGSDQRGDEFPNPRLAFSSPVSTIPYQEIPIVRLSSLDEQPNGSSLLYL